MDCGAGYFSYQYPLLWSQLHWRWAVVDMATEVSTMPSLSRFPFVMTNSRMQHRRCIQSAILDRHRSRIAPLPCRDQGTGQRASSSLQELDLPVGTLVLRHPEFVPCAGTRMEQLQPIFQGRDFCQSLCRVAYHAGHVRRLEGFEAYQDRKVT